MWKQMVIVGLGGGLGSMLRFVVYHYSRVIDFPVNTFLINITGSLVLGFLMGYGLQHFIGKDWKLFLTIGLCGGFTTFSTFSYENLSLIQSGKIFTACLYIVSSVAAGILAAWLGYKIAG